MSSLRSVIREHSIVLLQECFLNVLYDDIQHIFPEYHIIKGTLSGYRLINSGLVTLSRYPVLSHQFIVFETQNVLSADVLAEKGFLVVLITIRKQRLFVINTHLQSSAYRNDDTVAKQQWYQLKTYVSQLKGPWIIGGDFNMNISSLLNERIPYSVYASFEPSIYIKYDSDTEVATSCTNQSGLEPFVYDYFITNTIQLDPPCTLPICYSDHLPVSSKIKKNLD